MKNINYKLTVVLLLVVGIAAFNIYNAIKSPKIVYVDVVRLYNGFALKLQLEEELLAAKQIKQKGLDSLANELNYLLAMYEDAKEGEIPDSVLKKYLLMQNSYQTMEEDVKTSSLQMADTFDAQIWFQLNEYIKNYGEVHSYDIILGAKGDGEILYGVEAFDITNDMIAFANSQYNGI